MVKDHRVNLLSFTGSTEVGRIVGQHVQARFGKVSIQFLANKMFTPFFTASSRTWWQQCNRFVEHFDKWNFQNLLLKWSWTMPILISAFRQSHFPVLALLVRLSLSAYSIFPLNFNKNWRPTLHDHAAFDCPWEDLRPIGGAHCQGVQANRVTHWRSFGWTHPGRAITQSRSRAQVQILGGRGNCTCQWIPT